MSYFIVNRDELSRSGDTYEFEGYLYGNTNVSVILVDLPPGEGPKLHVHPYEEIFIVQEGRATFTLGDTTREVEGGYVVIGPAHVPHKFINSGEGLLKMINIHPGKEVIQQWLED